MWVAVVIRVMGHSVSGLIVRLRTALRGLGGARFDWRFGRWCSVRYGGSAKLTHDAAFQGSASHRSWVGEQDRFDCILGDAFDVGVGESVQRGGEAAQVHIRLYSDLAEIVIE